MSIGPRPGDDDGDDDYDVMSSEPMGEGPEPTDDDDGEDWDTNEMADQDGPDEDDGTVLEASEDDQEGEEQAEEGEDELEPIEPPANWPEEIREAFGAIPPQLQHWYVNTARHMQADYTRKTQAIAQEKQQIQRAQANYAELDRITAPYEQQWALNGMSKPQAISQLIALSNFATNDPKGFIQYFANLRGVDLQQLNEQQEYVDPQVAALRQPLAEVQARLNQLQEQNTAWQQQQQYQQYQSAFQSVNASIDDFARRTGQDGKPLYPHLNEVMGEMADLIETGRARSMDEAYRHAIWLNESTRNRELQRSRANENARNRQRAEKARRAGSSLSGASGANGAYSSREMSIRDTINGVMDGSL